MKCHVCQDRISPSQAVVLREQTDEAKAIVAPCCFMCWREIPPGQRLTIAQRIVESYDVTTDRRLMNIAILKAITQGLKSANRLADGFYELAEAENSGDEWRKGRPLEDEDDG